MTDDFVTVALRVTLGVVAGGCSMATWSLFYRSRDQNWVPWAFLAGTFASYSTAMILLVTDNRLTVEDWWRPAFSILNMAVMVGSLWVLRRVVRHAH